MAKLRYLVSTGVSASITVGLPIIMVEGLGFEPSLATGIALALALVVNFLVLKFYVFRSDAGWQAQAVRYVTTAAGFRLLEYLLFLSLHEVLGLNYFVALVAILVFSFVAKYFVYQVVVFSDTATPEASSQWRIAAMARSENLKAIGAASATMIAVALFALFKLDRPDWDFYNYHLYNGYAYLAGVTHTNIMPAQSQTFLAPYLDVFVFWLWNTMGHNGATVTLGLIHGLQPVLIFMVVRTCLAQSGLNNVVLPAVLAAIIGCFAPIYLEVVGGESHDSIIAILFLAALLFFVKATEADQTRPYLFIALGGALMGGAVALKLTAGPYGFGLVVVLAILSRDWHQRLRYIGVYGASALAVFLVINGAWMMELYQRYQNPIFPFLNSIFESPLVATRSFGNELREAQNLRELIFYPFLFTADPSRISPSFWADMRYAFFYFVMASGIFSMLAFFINRVAQSGRIDVAYWKDQLTDLLEPYRLWIALAAGSAAIFFSWMAVFPTYRYLSGVEALMVLFAAAWLVPVALGRVKVAIWMALVLIGVTCLERLPTIPKLFPDGPSVELAAIDDLSNKDLSAYDGATVVMVGFEPTSFVIPFFPKDVQFVRVQAKFDRVNLLNTASYAGLHQQAIEAVKASDRPFFALFAKDLHRIPDRDTLTNARLELAALGLILSDECTALFDTPTVPDLRVCRVTRVPSGS